MFYSDEDNVKLCKVIETEEEKLPRGWAFFGHWNVQHAGGRWRRNHGLSYLLYLIPVNVDLIDEAAFEYEDSTEHEVRNKREVLLSGVDPLYMSAEKDLTDDDVSRITVTVEIIEEKDEYLCMDVWSDYPWMRRLRRIRMKGA